MKTLSSAEADFRANERDVNTVQDFWAGDLSALYVVLPAPAKERVTLLDLADLLPPADRDPQAVPLTLHWSREDRRKPGVVGTETLTLELAGLVAGKRYEWPGEAARATYAMATPSLGQGARAIDLRGSLVVDEVTDTEIAVTVDLSARMARLDRPVQFDERVRGSFRLARR